MNIFYLDDDMETCAQYHCDKHIGKMLMETVQILSTALHIHGIDGPYRPTHKNHPCVKWAAYSTGNFKLLTLLGTKLANEYKHRYPKGHASALALKLILKKTKLNTELPMDDHIASRVPLAMPDMFKQECTVGAYRDYYRSKLVTMKSMSYTNRDVPQFLQEI